MSIKRIHRTIPFLILLLLSSWTAAATEPLHLATWNIRILSDNSRDDGELREIASILARYDLIVIQEARDTVVLDRLTELLPGYTYTASPPAGRGVKELYCFFYREDRAELLEPPALLADPEDLFIREPFIGRFRSGEADFTLVTIHSIYGDSVRQRRAEAALLDDVVRLIEEASGEERDIWLLGDFNLPGDDKAWEMAPRIPLVPSDMKTTISDRSSYDNIWYDPDASPELRIETLRVYPFDELLFGNDDRTASRRVSDHRPVSLLVDTTSDDD